MKNKAIKIFGMLGIALFILMALVPATVSADERRIVKEIEAEEGMVDTTLAAIKLLGGKVVGMTDREVDGITIYTIKYTMEGERDDIFE